jgi:hypothetical protein
MTKNQIFFTAVLNNHVEIVRKYINDPEVDPSMNANTALVYANYKGFTEIVDILLAHPKVDKNVLDDAFGRVFSAYFTIKCITKN